MSITRPIIKLFVTDYDNCALIPSHSDRDDFLSPDLIAFAKQNNFQGFYGCTHRSLLTLTNYDKDYSCFYSTYVHLMKKYSAYFGKPLDFRNTLTLRVTENLEKTTGLKCLAISTPDDRCPTAPKSDPLLQCGFGYKNFISIYENEILEKNKNNDHNNIIIPFFTGFSLPHEHKPLSLEEFQKTQHTKNPQLIQIARHARATFGPEPIIEIHYLDDVLKLCLDIENINTPDLPNDIILKSYQHSHAEQVMIKPTKEISTYKPLENRLQDSSLPKETKEAKPQPKFPPQIKIEKLDWVLLGKQAVQLIRLRQESEIKMMGLFNQKKRLHAEEMDVNHPNKRIRIK